MKNRPVAVELPPLDTPAGIDAGLTALAHAAAEGRADAEQTEIIARVLEMKRKSLETADIEDRLSALEQRAHDQPPEQDP